MKREGEGRKGKKMGESGERELRKTPEGKLRRKEYEKKGQWKRKDKNGGREWGDMRREQFPSGGEQKTRNRPFPNFPLFLDFPPLGIIIYMSKEYLISKE